jgi:phosphate transport system substrate-binding protein
MQRRLLIAPPEQTIPVTKRQFLIFPTLFAIASTAGCASSVPRDVPSAAATRAADLREAAALEDDSEALPPYSAVAALSGTITSIGASTTTNLVAHAATEFRRIYPSVKLQVTAGLASIGPSALLGGRADIVPMSRPLQPQEMQEFKAKYGYPPTEIKVAADALAIFVEKRNPVPGLTLEQLDGIFSRTQRRGGPSIETWGGTGLTGEWRERGISLYGYGPGDGANQVFRASVLNDGEYRLLLVAEPAGSAIVQDIAADPLAIGYASVFFASKRTRTVPLAGSDGHFYAPTAENIREHRYPLSRFLYICVNKAPNRALDRPVAEFLRFLLSLEGQQIVAAGGNVQLDAATVRQG